MVKWLDASRIGHGEVTAYATPRRLAVWVQNVADKQEDVSEEVKGLPARSRWMIADSGARQRLVLQKARALIPSFTFKELGGVEYIYVTKNSVGVDTKSILPEGLLAF